MSSQMQEGRTSHAALESQYGVLGTPRGRFHGLQIKAARAHSEFPIVILGRIKQLLRVVSYAVLEDDFHVLDVRDVRGWITLDDHEISVLADRDRADLSLAAEEDRTVQSRDLNGLHGRKSRLHQ